MQLLDAILALAFVGDLSMGRATDHSRRTACLAGWLAQADGADGVAQNHARAVALLRWSGCTANATGFAELLGDDVAAREAMMAQTLPPMDAQTQALILPLAIIHCEISGDVAANLGMPSDVISALRHIFERHDGSGSPGGLGGGLIARVAHYANVASDLEILANTRGRTGAFAFLRDQAGCKYPADLAMLAVRFGESWLDKLAVTPPKVSEWDFSFTSHVTTVQSTLLADVVELKLPWLAGHSRQVAQRAARCAETLGLQPKDRDLLHEAALLHGLGRAALPNRLWETSPDRLSIHQWEQLRLMPYWTSRAARQIPGLSTAGDLGSYAFERLDGSGYFRGVGGAALSLMQRILATAVAYQTLLEARPWRPAYTRQQAAAILRDDVRAGCFDSEVVESVLAADSGLTPALQTAPAGGVLSPREIDVLREISLGASNKEAARLLDISPSTVRTHVESIFRKLECTTRAAATLKALTAGLI
ncbi:HD domain-containing phosphohydrolase [Pseudomonas matsuisoli]|uniref:HD domain-containing protein n=1 Tax=Pseudomonas matsuisoli TaxID=1515666 RepID=A0A917PYB8_9PSED|nr:HD domain-containing phosphohydrolase [Pseudomonas matsuisoli]GGJ98713.1 hypothetical protein GCM10009304_25730 [Pseudomonas matsuisoli]